MGQAVSAGVVVLGFGPQPMDWIGRAAKLCGKDAVIDPDVARMAGANLAAGAPDALAALRKRLEAGALQHMRTTTSGLSPEARRWLAVGERGASSDALFTRLLGFNATRGAQDGVACCDHPCDAADLRRCRLMLEQVGIDNISDAAGMSPQWGKLVEHWEIICFTMDAETPDWRSPKPGTKSPETYQLIKQAIGR